MTGGRRGGRGREPSAIMQAQRDFLEDAYIARLAAEAEKQHTGPVKKFGSLREACLAAAGKANSE